jgi:hypothetical protein
MKRKAALLAVAFATAAPAVIAPNLSAVKAQDAPAGADAAEYPDVPRGHWAYAAIDRLSKAGIIEGLPNGTYAGQKPMTRYEFAVAIARLLERLPTGPGGPGYDDTDVRNLITGLRTDVTALQARPIPDITRAEVNDLIAALRREFADELARLGVRVDALENRVSALENRVSAPNRVTITPSLLMRAGTATYISQVGVAGNGAFAPAGPGRTIVAGNDFASAGQGLPRPPYTAFPDRDERVANARYTYTDFEVRLTDRITDRLSVTGALRSLGSTQEDQWAGESAGFGGTAYVREAYAVADLSDRSFLGIKGLTGILGRQRTKIGQGLLYDNDLQPTDQIHGAFNLGPFAINAFIGSNNNQVLTGAGNNPYLGSGAVANIGLSGGVFGGANFVPGRFNTGSVNAQRSGAIAGFPNAGVTGYPDDNESAVRAGFNLFRIAGQPVSIGVTRLFDGVTNQKGDSVDLTIPLFNRTIGIEYVRQRQYAFGGRTSGNPDAYNITVPLFRSRLLDANFAYGKAEDDFEYFIASSANPYARTYGEALFDRPVALGAPMINGRFFNFGNGLPGVPAYATAKEAYDFNGTLRILKRIPLDFRYYKAYGSRLAGGRQIDALDLGSVYTVGSTFNVSPGLDLELKYGQYNVYGPYPNIRYVRVGANVGF